MNFVDEKGRRLVLSPHLKEISLEKLRYKNYTNITSEDLDLTLEFIKSIVESKSAKHYYDRDSAMIILGNIRIYIDYWILSIDNEVSTKFLNQSSLVFTKGIFNKFLINFNDG